MKPISELLNKLRSLDVKIWVDGNTIRYNAPKETLTPALLNQLRERKAEILEFLQNSHLPPILSVNRDRNLPLSFAQQRLWFLEQLEPNRSTYCIATVYRLTGSLNVTALEQSLHELVQRHEILRTTFPSVDGLPVQVISKETALTLPLINLEELSPNQREAEAQRQAKQEAQRPFNLAQGPLFRAKLLRLTAREHVLLLNMHHIISDGWSFDVSFRELTALYQAFASNKPSPLPKLPIQYADFALWQREWIQDEFLQSQLDYWRQQLSGELPVLQLPTDHPRPPVKTYQGAHQSLELSKDLTQALKALSQQQGVTLFMTLLASFQTLLFRYCGQSDIIVGTPIAGRNQAETNRLIGFFVNTLVLRTDLSGNPSFRELLSQVREVTLAAYAHQELPFEKLVEELQPERDLSRSPLFQIMFAFQNVPNRSFWELSGLELTPFKIANETSKFDLTLNLQETSEGIQGGFEYNTDLFKAETIKRLIKHFEILLEGIVANPEQKIGELPLLTEFELHQILVEWNDTQAEYPKDKCIHQLFEAQVDKTPDAVAVVFEDEYLTYQQLNQKANQLAHYLPKLGVKSEVSVGICLEKVPEMIIALLAILKAGGAYVPLDPNYPNERIGFMLKDTDISVLLTQPKLVKQIPEFKGSTVYIDKDWHAISKESEENLVSNIAANNLAYVMYTSGSTGQPKGICVTHRGVVRLVKNSNYANLTSEETFLQLAPIAFDASTFEIWGCLLNGGKLVLFPEQQLSLETLGQTIRHHQITTLWLTAGLFNLMVDERVEDLKPLRQLLAGGDVLSVPHVQKFRQHNQNCQLINGYGPTENTTFSCCYPIENSKQVTNSIPIGKPIANTQVYILDKYLQPVPIGVPGELCIGGDGLARGYLNRPELTEEKFIPNPFSNSKFTRQNLKSDRLYKTGDLARYLPNGNIEFLGRIDNQVKIRSFRIELGEIEFILSQHPQVREAVVIDREDQPGNKSLVAYLVPKQEAVSLSKLRQFLAQKLPDYMLPSAFVELEAMPLTPNGKVDRRALPPPVQAFPKLESEFVSPRNLIQEMLARIWAEVLSFESFNFGPSQLNIYDNFFDLGGHSLVAVRLISRVREVFQLALPLRQLFESPTIAELAKYIETERRTNRLGQQTETKPWFSLLAIQPGGSQRPFFLLPGGGGGEIEFIIYAKLVYLLGQEQPVYGLQARGLDGKQEPHPQVEAMATDYIKEIRAIQPEGPYLLGGECTGGVVALEMAQQLQAQGEKVALLVLMNTERPSNSRELSYRINELLPIGRILYHLSKLPQLESGERFLYIFDKARKAKEKIISKFHRHSKPLISSPHPMNRKFQKNTRAKHIKRVRQNYYEVLERYRPPTYLGKITLLVSEDHYQQDPTRGWNHIAAGGLEIHKLPGDHDSYLGEHVQTTAEELKACLEGAIKNSW